MQYLLDTNICIYIIKKHPARVISTLKKHNISDIGISSITLAELHYGVEKSDRIAQNTLALAEFVAPLEIIAFSEAAAIEFGKIRAHLEKKGTLIGEYDLLIAAHARSLGATIITNNVREFNRVPELKVENWA